MGMGIEKYEGNRMIATHSFTVFPQDLNYADTLFGGITMQHMDIAGVKVVRRALYNTDCDGAVTASVDRIDFKKPAFLGDLITMNAEIKTLGKSSIQIKISVSRESQKGLVEDICAANFTFVAMKDKKSHPHGLSFQILGGTKDE